MQSGLTIGNWVALFGAMALLAAIPSMSVLTVTTRSASLGWRHGVATAIGIVVGDILFILLAIWGLSFVAETMNGLFAGIKYLGGAYLIWLGIQLWRSSVSGMEIRPIAQSSFFSSFLAGLVITLADQKAILFYLGFFPAFLDLSQITYLDTAMIILITITAVGGMKLGYAFMADRSRILMSPKIRTGINRLASSVMILVGVILITKR